MQFCPVQLAKDVPSSEIKWVFDPLNKTLPDPLKINEIAGDVVEKLISLFNLVPTQNPSPPPLTFANTQTIPTQVVGVNPVTTVTENGAAAATAVSG